MAEDLAAEHRDAAKLAEIAGRALVELRADPPSLRDLGAAGDRMAHQLLVAELNRLYPDDDVRSEEGLEHVAGTGRLWIIDPLDGTREFRQPGRSDWAVHVAMAVGGSPWLGPWPCRRSISFSAPGSLRCCRLCARASRHASWFRGAVLPMWPTT